MRWISRRFSFFYARLVQIQLNIQCINIVSLFLTLNRDLLQGTKNNSRETTSFPANIYLYKANNRDTRRRCEMCSQLTIKAPERRHGSELLLQCLKQSK